MNEKRLQQFQRYLKEKRIPMAFIQGKANLFYLSGFRCEPHERLVALLVFAEEAPCLVAPHMETALIQTAGWNGELISYHDHENPWQLLGQYLNKFSLSPKRAAFEKGLLSFARYEELQHLLPEASFVDCEQTVMGLRLIKDESEIAILREAAKLADFGIEIGVQAIQAGRTEMEILAMIEYELKKKGVAEMSFSTIVLSGPQSANPHGKPGMRTIKDGDFVLFDLGVVLEGYCSDITRTVGFGPLSKQQQEIYQTVLDAQLATLAISKPGTVLGELDRTARKIITDAGYGQYFPHRIGHGLGTETHEYPSLHENNEHTLQPGMVYTIEPGIYIPEVGGVRIEDDVVVTEQGVECLTSYPKELQVIV